MSEQEIRAQKAMLLLEYNEAKEQVANLKERARRIASALRQIARLLEEDPASIWTEGQSTHGALFVQPLPRDLTTAVDLSSILKVASELREATATLKDLTDRKSNLNL